MVDFDALNLVAMLLDDPDADVRSEVFGFCAELGDYHDPTLHSDEDTELPFLTLRAFLAQRAVLAAVARRLSGRRESVDAQVALVRALHPVILYGDNVLSALVAVDMFSVLAHLIPVHDFLFHTFVSTPFDCAVDIFRGIFERGDPALLRALYTTPGLLSALRIRGVDTRLSFSPLELSTIAQQFNGANSILLGEAEEFLDGCLLLLENADYVRLVVGIDLAAYESTPDIAYCVVKIFDQSWSDCQLMGVTPAALVSHERVLHLALDVVALLHAAGLDTALGRVHVVDFLMSHFGGGVEEGGETVARDARGDGPGSGLGTKGSAVAAVLGAVRLHLQNVVAALVGDHPPALTGAFHAHNVPLRFEALWRDRIARIRRTHAEHTLDSELATYAGDRDLRADMWRNLIGVTDTMVAGQLLQTALPDLLAASLGDEVVFVAGGGVAALAGVIGTVGGGSTASAIAGSRETRVTSLHAHDAFVLRNEALGMLADLLGHRESHANGRLHKMVQLVFHALARAKVVSRARALLDDVFAGDDSADNSYGSLTSSDSRAQPVDVRRRRALGLAALDLFAVLLLHGSHDCDALAFGIKAHHGDDEDAHDARLALVAKLDGIIGRLSEDHVSARPRLLALGIDLERRRRALRR